MDWTRSKAGNLWCEFVDGGDKVTITIMPSKGGRFGLFGCYARDRKGFHPATYESETAAQLAAEAWAPKLLAKRRAMRRDAA